jgi:RNA polymerase sigma factor (sigma-70 family)
MNNQQGKESFLLLIQGNKAIIFKICNAYCASIHDREDLAQEIIYNLWKSWPAFDNSYKFSTWMYRVALNVAISYYRKQSKNVTTVYLADHENEIAGDEEHDATDEDVQLLQQFISELKPLDRALILLYADGNTYAEIADILGITETNTATKISRIKNNLKQKAVALNK